MYEYKTIEINGGTSLDELNKLYADGWQYVDAIRKKHSNGGHTLFYTLRIEKMNAWQKEGAGHTGYKGIEG